MSRRLDLLNALLRRTARPRLARMPVGARSNAEIGWMADIFLRRPPNLQHVVDTGAPTIHWISVGPVAHGRVVVHFHGGAYVAGSPRNRRGMLGRLSGMAGVQVAAPVYRLAPVHRAPAQFEDALAAHARLLGAGYKPQNIVIGGDSAGGGLALALLSDLCRRGLRPGGVYAISPWTDLTLSGASLRENAARDPFLPVARISAIAGDVLGDLPADDPRASPLFAPFEAPPPVQIHVGSTEILRDDAVRMADRLRQAGGETDLRIWPDAPHIWPIFAGYVPEADATLREIAGFVRRCFGAESR